MKLTHITAQNYLGARAVDLTLTTPVTILAGKNGAGKSSLQEAIRKQQEAAAAEAKRLEDERIAAERRAAEEKDRAAREEAARVEAKRQAKEREAQRIARESNPPNADGVVALVAKHYDVSESAARHWLAEMFGIQQAA